MDSIITRLLKVKRVFDSVAAINIIVDSQLPEAVEYWSAFAPWWNSRRKLVGSNRDRGSMVPPDANLV